MLPLLNFRTLYSCPPALSTCANHLLTDRKPSFHSFFANLPFRLAFLSLPTMNPVPRTRSRPLYNTIPSRRRIGKNTSLGIVLPLNYSECRWNIGPLKMLRTPKLHDTSTSHVIRYASFLTNFLIIWHSPEVWTWDALISFSDDVDMFTNRRTTWVDIVYATSR